MDATLDGQSDGNLAATYALIYSFLTARSHDKAAAAVKKAAKDIVVLKDDVKGDDAALDEIIKWWKLKKEADSKNESNPNSDSESSSDGGSSDSSPDDSSDSDSSSSSPSSSSESDSSDSSSSSEPKTTKPGIGASKPAKATFTNGQVVDDAPSGQSGQTLSSTDLKIEDASKKLGRTKSKKEAKAKDPSSSDSSDSDESNSSDSSNGTRRAKSVKGNQVAPAEKVKATVISVTVLEHDSARATKKRRTSESGNAVVTAVVEETTETVPTPKQNGKANGKQPRKSNTPFQRIKADEVEFHDERLKDNAFVARGASANDYGAKASQDLIVTRGDGFRKEKNKKKRGSYRGGEITMQSHSIKFT